MMCQSPSHGLYAITVCNWFETFMLEAENQGFWHLVRHWYCPRRHGALHIFCIYNEFCNVMLSSLVEVCLLVLQPNGHLITTECLLVQILQFSGASGLLPSFSLTFGVKWRYIYHCVRFPEFLLHYLNAWKSVLQTGSCHNRMIGMSFGPAVDRLLDITVIAAKFRWLNFLFSQSLISAISLHFSIGAPIFRLYCVCNRQFTRTPITVWSGSLGGWFKISLQPRNY